MENLKLRAAEIRAAIADGSATDEMVNELETIVSELETYARKADIAARSVAAANSIEAPAVDVEDAAPATAGEAFVRSAAYTNYGKAGRSAAVEVETRAFTGLADLNIAPQRVNVPTALAPLPLSGIVGKETVSTNTIEYIVENFTSEIAVVAEGEVKPESTFSTDLVAASLDTVAHYVNVSRQALEDEARVQSIINNKLSRGVDVKKEAAIATALTGGTYTTATGSSLLAAIRNGKAVVEAEGFTPTQVVMNPADAAAADISLMNGLNGPVVNNSYWGLQVVTSSAVPAGTAFVGDFGTAITEYNRTNTAIYVSDSHDNNFIKNIFTILAETRSKAVVTNPGAIAKATAA